MIRRSILATLVYYDILDYPLTEFEIWKHLIRPSEPQSGEAIPTLADISRSVELLVQEGKILSFRGFLVFPHRESLVLARIHEEKRAVRKIRRAARLAHFLSWVPYVRMIGLTGSLSLKQGDPASDWDFFVALREGAIWRGRLILSFILQIMGKRRHGRYIENRACLNHFVTDTSLEIAMQDLFSAHEYRFMYPLLGTKTYRTFELANRWMNRVKPTFSLTEIPTVWSVDTHIFLQKFQGFLERCLDILPLEPFLARLQKKKIEKNPNTHLPGAFILANEKALIFLPHPKGPAIFDRFKQALSAL